MAYRNADITALYEKLRPFDTLNPPDRYWIEDSEGQDATGGYDFCFECGSDCADRLNLYTPGELTHDLTCCDPCGESDVIPHCHQCGKTLAGWPTDYCASEELSYFTENDADATPENIHVVNMMLWNLQWSEDDEGIAAWRAVAEKMADKLPERAVAEVHP